MKPRSCSNNENQVIRELKESTMVPLGTDHQWYSTNTMVK